MTIKQAIDIHPSHEMVTRYEPTFTVLRCIGCEAECYEDKTTADPNMHIKNQERLEAPCTHESNRGWLSNKPYAEESNPNQPKG
jgi:hypothetical protein